MSGARPLRAWASRLLAIEGATSASETSSPTAEVFGRLRISLTRVVGPDGFAALQKRALALARAEIPALGAVKVTPDGRLEGIEALSDGGKSATAIFAHVLGLLIAFIGESLTLRLMHEAFPDAPSPSIGELKNLT